MSSTTELTNDELSLINDRAFLLAKREIIDKIHLQLGRVEKHLHPLVQAQSFPEGVLTRAGKISKGDSYQGLPYLVLDYPRAFDKQGIFAFRTMFWWGHHFSSTLHLGGDYLDYYRAVLLKNLEGLTHNEGYFCVNNGPWHYHYESSNYLPYKQMDPSVIKDSLAHKPFIKLSQRWSLDQFQQLPELVTNHFLLLMSWCASR